MDYDFEAPTIAKPAEARRRDWPSRRRRMMIRLAVVLGCVVALTVMLARAVAAAREAARRSQCICNLCGIKMALLNYHDTYGSYPPAFVAGPDGRPWHSWRVLILPLMEQRPLHDQYRYDEPWDGPNNRKLIERMPPILACPSRRASREGLTSYVAITGPGTIFPGAGTTTIKDVADGTSNTIFLAEVANVDIPWTAPRDLDVRSMSFRVNDPDRPSVSSPHHGGANIVFADGAARFLRDSANPALLRAATTIAGGEGVTANQVAP